MSEGPPEGASPPGDGPRGGSGQWTMTTHKNPDHRCFEVWIGAVLIAQIFYVPKLFPKVFLACQGQKQEPYENMSAALRQLHFLLKSPPPYARKADSQ